MKFGLVLASQSTARRDAKEASDARTALRKRWVGVVEKLGPGLPYGAWRGDTGLGRGGSSAIVQDLAYSAQVVY